LRFDLQTVSTVAMSMATELDRPPARLGPHDDAAAADSYRVVSITAVVSCVLGIVSVIALLDFWALKAVPVFGLVAGLAALRQISAAPQEFSGRKAAVIGVAASALFLFAGTGLAFWTYVAEVPDGYRRIGYEQLKPTAEQPHLVPASAVQLDGQRVFIKGFMFPTPHDKGVRRFVLCRDNGDCCFGGEPPKSDMVFVELVEPLDTEFSTRMRHVAGTFRVAGMRSTDVNQDVLYRLEADYIR